jgi:hypothetical protein
VNKNLSMVFVRSFFLFYSSFRSVVVGMLSN